ncbi:hypothetical protein M0D46_21090 [Xanthomonas prunicola]|uniref:hypothetical protein n=1 Tax=Xanthomonas prunicola TaxID=2053930 RepID=UPI0021B25362|nr:hypothetical protein [Xanthomonas prunicola]UXA69460.1 hypothetical protein M0D46_21090 [Xanthomonas prunicola]
MAKIGFKTIFFGAALIWLAGKVFKPKSQALAPRVELAAPALVSSCLSTCPAPTVDQPSPSSSEKPGEFTIALSFPLFFGIVFFFVTVTAGVVIYAAYGWLGFFEYLAYLLPVIAGLLSGIGLYSRPQGIRIGHKIVHIDLWVYKVSAILLLSGFGFFIAYKQKTYDALINSLVSLALAFSISLLIAGWGKRKKIDSVFLLSFALTLIILSLYLGWILWLLGVNLRGLIGLIN